MTRGAALDAVPEPSEIDLEHRGHSVRTFMRGVQLNNAYKKSKGKTLVNTYTDELWGIYDSCAYIKFQISKKIYVVSVFCPVVN